MTNKPFKVYWREKSSDFWEIQEEFPRSWDAHNYVSEQPDGGYYQVRDMRNN